MYIQLICKRRSQLEFSFTSVGFLCEILWRASPGERPVAMSRSSPFEHWSAMAVSRATEFEHLLAAAMSRTTAVERPASWGDVGSYSNRAVHLL